MEFEIGGFWRGGWEELFWKQHLTMTLLLSLLWKEQRNILSMIFLCCCCSRLQLPSFKDTKDMGFDDGGRVLSSRSPGRLQSLDMQRKTEKTHCHVDWVHSWPERQTSGFRVLLLPGLPSFPCHQRILWARLTSVYTYMWELLKMSFFFNGMSKPNLNENQEVE